MASGPELMIGALFRGLGFNPVEFKAKIDGFLTYVQGKLDAFTMTAGHIDARLSAIEASQEETRQKLDLILAHLKGKVIDHDGSAIGYRYDPNRINGSGTATSDAAERSGADPTGG